MSEHLEIEPETKLVPYQPHVGALEQQQSISSLEQAFALAVRQRELLSDYIAKQLKPGKHFYEPRGGSKPSLAHEGAEIIVRPYGYSQDYEHQTGPQEPPGQRKRAPIRLKCRL